MVATLLTPAEAGEYLGGYSVPSLAQLRYTGNGPLYIKLTGRAVRYRIADLDAWIETRVRASTASPAA